ncbi:MAG: PAS domain S-box protein [Dehalococcoidia bacterium]|nr:PAS domain S-box protein [Dehalococcoidia bacterium]
MALPQGKILRLLLNFHFWILLAILTILTMFHYSAPFGGLIPYSAFGLTRHTADRVLLLVPIVYAAIIFGVKGGIVFLLLSLGIMLPRALVFSASRTDAIVEVIGIALVGILITGWFDTLQKERRLRQKSIEELEKTQRELLVDEKRLAALNSISHCLSLNLDLQEALDKALEQIVQVMNLDMALVFILTKTADELNLKAYYGVSEEFAEGVRWLGVGEGLNGRVAQTGEPLVVEDTAHDPRLTREVVARERVVAQLIVPVKARDKVTGTLAVGMHRLRRFTPDEIEILMAIGDEIGVAIENNRLYKEQQFMAEQLRQSEQSYRELFEKAHDAIWVHDLEGNITTANEAAAKLVGYSVEELLDLNVRVFLDDQSLKVAKEVRRKLLAGELLVQPYEQKLIRRDGSEANLMLTTSLLARDGVVQAVQHIARDVTEQKHMDENLRFYVRQITRAQEEERKRIARELHDDTAQQLIVLSRQLDKIISAEPSPMKDMTPVEKLSERVDNILDGVRRFSQDLRPSVLDDLGLIPALEWLASDMTAHFNISVSVEVKGTERRFPPEKELLLFRIVQEALSNVRKHSSAQSAWVIIEFTEKQTMVIVKDSGKGFKVPEHLSDLTGMAKLGLAGMAERARLLDGELTIDSGPGKGTTVTVTVPF